MDLKLNQISEAQALTYLQFTLDQLSAAACLYDAQGSMLYANSQFAAWVDPTAISSSFISRFSTWLPQPQLEALWQQTTQCSSASFTIAQDRDVWHCTLQATPLNQTWMLKIELDEQRSLQSLQHVKSQFSQLFNNPSIAIVTMDCQEQQFQGNDRFRQILHPLESADSHFSDLIHPDDRDLDADLRQRLLSGRLPFYTIEQRFFTGNRSLVWMNKTVLFVPGAAAIDPPRLLVLLEDATEIRKVYHALALSEGKWHEFVSTSANLYLESGLSGQIVYASPTIERILGYTADEVLDCYLSDFVHPEDLNQFDLALRAWSNSLDHPLDYQSGLECRWLNKSGQWVYLSLQGKRFSPGGEGNTLLIQAYDVTDRKILEDEMSRLKAISLSLPGATFRCGPDYQMGFLSHPIEAITGYPASDFIHNRVRSFLSIVYPPDRQKLRDRMNSRSAAYSTNYRIVHANGSIQQVYERGQRMFDRSGKLLWIDGVILDAEQSSDLSMPHPSSAAMPSSMLPIAKQASYSPSSS